MTDGIISISETFLDSIPREISGQVADKLNLLRTTPESSSLHVEKINGAKDDRIRSIRVNLPYRILAFRLNSSGQDLWLVEGVYEHDDAYRRSRTLYLRVNPISGTTEIRTDADAVHTAGGLTESEVRARAAALAAQQIAEHQEAERRRQEAEAEAAQDAEQPEPLPQVTVHPPVPRGPVLSVSARDLVDQLGIDEDLAEAAVEADEETLLDIAAAAPSWQASALLDLATGSTLDVVREAYFTGVTGGSGIGEPSQTEDLFGSLTSERSKSTFHLVHDDESLAKVLASGTFAQWRIFLHPEQQTYVDVNTRGPYRLTGGAGTGKTVVLVHRAVRLARAGISGGRAPRIVLTTFTRNLSDALEEQVRILDPTVRRSRTLGGPGVHITNVDRMAWGVISKGGPDLAPSMRAVLGWESRGPKFSRSAQEWVQAVHAVRSVGGIRDDAASHADTDFLIDEYREVILPQRIVGEADYLRAPRGGRGTRLGRNQRREVWAIVRAYREDGARADLIDWDESSALAAAVLDARAARTGERPADHVLVDEGQDLRPPQWMMLRALVAEGEDDMFIAEDSHQRIYSNPVKLGRYGIAIRGRSRRLKLNYRTTAEILGFAVSVLQGGEFDIAAMEEFPEGFERPSGDDDPHRFRSARTGPDVTFLPATDLDDEIGKVAELIRTWTAQVKENGGDPGTIGVLTRLNGTRDTIVRALDDRGVAVASVDRNNAYASGVPLVMSFHRAKGMEFTHVVLFGVDEASENERPHGGYDDQTREAAELAERALLYVGSTRARDELAVAWSRRPSQLLGRTE